MRNMTTAEAEGIIIDQFPKYRKRFIEGQVRFHSRPDQEGSGGCDVEYDCDQGGECYRLSVEITQLEPVQRMQMYSAWIERLRPAVESALRAELPRADIRMSIAAADMPKGVGSDRVAEHLVGIVRDRPGFGDGESADWFRTDDLGFEIRVAAGPPACVESPHFDPPCLIAPRDIEVDLRSSMRKALADNVREKLRPAKALDHATALILDAWELGHLSEYVVANAFVDEWSEEYGPRLDEVWIAKIDNHSSRFIPLRLEDWQYRGAASFDRFQSLVLKSYEQ